jgi:hypothetical protein
MRTQLLLAALLTGAPASAQSTIFGLDVRFDQFFSTTTDDFVGNFAPIGPQPASLFALDFDASASVLWGIDNVTHEYGTFDLATGGFTPLGVVSALTSWPTGLTAAPDGVTWYLLEYDAVTGRNFLFVGDVTTGQFSQVGYTSDGTIVDISIDSQGNLYGFNIIDDSLYRIDTATGQGSLIGPAGQDASFAQGMDFDWSDDTLYAGVYVGGGVGYFAEFDLLTGEAVVLQDTTPLGAECELAVRQPAPSAGSAYCFGDGSGTACPCGNPGGPAEGCANSTGSGAALTASGSSSVAAADLVLHVANALPNQPGLFFQGEVATNGGDGSPFGDGLRCAGTHVVRLETVVPDPSGDAQTSVDIGAEGGVSPGDIRDYQCWYRDPTASPCGSGFNLSNGFEVTWMP